MASNRNQYPSTNPSQEQSNRSSEYNRQESMDDQLQRAIKESARILKDATGSSKGYSIKSGPQWMNNKRIPRLYYINENKSILIILQGDITRTKVDAIVNAANEHMTGGSGVDGIIHHAAGEELYRACKAHKQISKGVRLPTGHSRILLSYNMSSTTYYIINTAGPMYSSYRAAECEQQLSSCYRTALALANLYDLESIGFTAISCGIFGYPANDGAEAALRTVDKEAKALPVVVFVLWDDHIYDAWVRKARELNFTVYDPEASTPITPYTPSTNDDEKKTTGNPIANIDRQQSNTSNTPLAENPSSQDQTDKTREDNSDSHSMKFPSVPDDSTDTQKTEDMESDDHPTDNQNRLTTQNTVEMTHADHETEASTTATTGNPPEPSSTEEDIKTSEEEKLEPETNRKETPRSIVAHGPNDPTSEKSE